jgi:hypothetical protein
MIGTAVIEPAARRLRPVQAKPKASRQPVAHPVAA